MQSSCNTDRASVLQLDYHIHTFPYFPKFSHFPHISGQLEVHLCPRGLYPYEPPLKLAYRLPDQLPPPPGSTGGTFIPLGFPAAAALTAAAWRRSLALCGEPQVCVLCVSGGGGRLGS